MRTHHNQETPSQNINKISGQIKLTNIRTINREKVVPPNTNREGWESVRDWDKVLREHKERIEREQKILNENLEKKRKKGGKLATLQLMQTVPKTEQHKLAGTQRTTGGG